MCDKIKYVAFDNTILKSCACGFRFPHKVVLDIGAVRSQTLLAALWDLADRKIVENKYENRPVYADKS